VNLEMPKENAVNLLHNWNCGRNRGLQCNQMFCMDVVILSLLNFLVDFVYMQTFLRL